MRHHHPHEEYSRANDQGDTQPVLSLLGMIILMNKYLIDLFIQLVDLGNVLLLCRVLDFSVNRRSGHRIIRYYYQLEGDSKISSI